MTAADQRPNIVFILSDQHASNVLGCYGDSIVRTPNLDKLATEGVRFENTYCASPICVPSRMSLLTGRYPSNQQCWTNSDTLASDYPTTAHALGAAGYAPVLVGRMHAVGPDQLHGYARREIGDHITDWYGGSPYTIGVLDKAQRPYRESLVNSGAGQSSYELLDREVTQQALKELALIANNRREGNNEPFALSIGYMLPHQPYVANPDLFAYYEGKIGPPSLAKPADEGDDTYLAWWRQQTGLNAVTVEEEVRARTAYYALVETVDSEIGKVLDTLDSLGLTENTLIIYASDHGEQLGQRGLWWKQTFYDESAKVPLIMKWAGRIPQNETCTQITNLVDLSAAMVEAGDGPALPGIDGHSLLPLALQADQQPETAWLDETYSEYCTDGLAAWSGGRVVHSRMVRSGQWKFNYYHGYQHQLFDLKSDPEEMHNLVSDPDHSALVEQLTEKILSGWCPEQINALMQSRNQQKSILYDWAKNTKPDDQFKWETRAEDNWLA